MIKFIQKTVIVIFIVSCTSSSFSQESKLNTEEKKIIINKLSDILKSNYVYPQIGEKMSTRLQNNLKNGLYTKIVSPTKFQKLINKDLNKIAYDKHLMLEYSTKELHIDENKNKDNSQKIIENQKKRNFGIGEVNFLKEGIGYIELNGFVSLNNFSKQAIAIAFAKLEGASTLIIDIRNNGGGEPEMVQLISSYFYDENPVLLNSMYSRVTDSIKDYYTLKTVAGIRFPDAKIYVLISKNSFSAAEEFCYNLKNLKRATLIGKTTGGAAHAGEIHQISAHFAAFIPCFKPINPFTKTNWENTGVSPDIEASSNSALNKAIDLAENTN